MTVARVQPAWSSRPLPPPPDAARPGGGPGGSSSTRPFVAVASVAEADTAAAVEEACCELEAVLGTSADQATEAAAETAAGVADAADAADAADVVADAVADAAAGCAAVRPMSARSSAGETGVNQNDTSVLV